MPLPSVTDIKWDFIINSIKSSKCVLMIGPEVPITREGVPLHSALPDYLNNLKNTPLHYYQDDEFFSLPDSEKLFTYFEISKFYEMEHPDDLYARIAQIPFHLIISVSPDLLLRKVFEKYHLPYAFHYYKKGENPVKVNPPTRDQPLIYNLFGSVEDDESLIFTHDDMFDFLFEILGSKPLPNNLLNELKAAKNFIFLGFKFDKWYVKLLLRLFKLHSGSFLRYASGKLESLPEMTKTFYEHHFKVNFVDSQVGDFVDELYTRCQSENMLRKLEASKAAVGSATLIRDYIASDEVDKALSLLLDMTKENARDLHNDVIIQSGSYNRLMRKVNNNLIDHEEATISLNKIKVALLEILDDAETGL